MAVASKQNKLVDAAPFSTNATQNWVSEQNYWISKVFDVLLEFKKSVDLQKRNEYFQ